ncbi:MAG TPA: NAD(+)/NADH kinase [Planctomycetota bacterium]
MPAERQAEVAIQSVLVLANADKPAARALIAELEPWLRARVARVAINGDVRAFREERQRALAERRAEPRPDLVVVLGGDGAILGAVHAFAEEPVPTLGINLGQVGFLAATPAASWREALAACLAGEAIEEPRLRLEASWRAGGATRRAVALNEITLQRSAQGGMIQAALWAGAHWVTNYRADGVIVATPSGSTAYSLSAGGPILETSLDAVVVTPICPQGLSNRPLVLPSTQELTLEVVASGGKATLAIDGQDYFELQEGERVTLRRHPLPVPLLWLPGMDPYRRLRERLGWRGSLDPAEGPSQRRG